MQVVQSAVTNMIRKEKRNMGSSDGEHGHCNRDFLCCHSSAERTTAWCILVNAPAWKPHTLFSSQSVGWNQSQDSPEQVAGRKHMTTNILVTVSASEKWYDFVLKHPDLFLELLVRSLCPTPSFYQTLHLCSDSPSHFLLSEGTSPFFSL